MGFFSTIGGGDSRNALKPAVPIVRLSSNGEERLSKMEATEYDSEFRILAAIKKYQPCEISEVAKEIGRSEDQTRYKVNELVSRKLVQVT